MKASETNFQPIIEGTKQYVIPLFQRPYSWDKKECGVLWTDLLDLVFPQKIFIVSAHKQSKRLVYPLKIGL